MTNDRAFVGRQPELEQLFGALAAARQRNVRTVLIGGEPGIGKTALVEELARTTPPPTVLWARSPMPAAEQIAYAPLLDLVRLVSRNNPSVLEELGPELDDLGPLLPTRRAEPGAWPTDPVFARVRLLEALRTLIESLATDKPPLVVVFDDLQWADDASVDAFSYLVRQLRDTPVLLIGSYRAGGGDPRPALERVLVELVRLDGVSHIALGPIAAADLAVTAPDLSARRVDAIAERAGGNPYFFEQLVAVAESSKSLPDDLRDFVLLPLAALPGVCRLVAQIAAVAGPLAAGPLIETVVAAPADVPAALGLLTKTRVLEPPRDPRGAYLFRAPLLRDAVVADMSATERARLHRAIAMALDADARLRSPGPAGLIEVAVHWASADEPLAARSALLAGAAAAEEGRAFELTHALLERVVEADSRPAPVTARVPLGFKPPLSGTAGADSATVEGLLLRTAEMANLAGQPARAVALAAQALSSGEAGTRRHLILERIGSFELTGGDVTAALDALDRAAAAAADADPSDRARILATRGRALMLAGRFADARETLSGAVDAARSSGDRGDESRALQTLASVAARAGDLDEANRNLEAARVVDALRTGSVIMPRPSRIGYVISGLVDQVVDQGRLGVADRAMTASDVAAQAAGRVGGQAAWGGHLTATATGELFLLGRWGEIDAAYADYPADQLAPPEGEVTRARLASARGDHEPARRGAARAVERARDRAPAVAAEGLAALAEIALWQGRADEARDAAAEALDLLVGSEDELQIAEIVALGLRADDLRAELARVRRATAELGEITEDALLLAARAGSSATGEPSPARGRLGAVRLLSRAELLTALGIPDAGAWEATTDAFDALRETYNAALARVRLAETLLAHHQNRPLAESSLRSAMEVGERLAARPLLDEIRQIARRARIDLQAVESSARAMATPKPEDSFEALRKELGLSAREIEVLGLIALGRTNRQIAEELFITEKTAGHHVSNILTKLTLSSRVEAAAVAHRIGLIAALEASGPVP